MRINLASDLGPIATRALHIQNSQMRVMYRALIGGNVDVWLFEGETQIKCRLTCYPHNLRDFTRAEHDSQVRPNGLSESAPIKARLLEIFNSSNEKLLTLLNDPLRRELVESEIDCRMRCGHMPRLFAGNKAIVYLENMLSTAEEASATYRPRPMI